MYPETRLVAPLKPVSDIHLRAVNAHTFRPHGQAEAQRRASGRMIHATTITACRADHSALKATVAARRQFSPAASP
jgi:hypothetical protein